MMPPTRTSERRSATFDMYRNAELDVYEEMRAEGRQTPTKPTIPPLAVKLGVFSDVENRYDEFVAAYVQDNVLEVRRRALGEKRHEAIEVLLGAPLDEGGGGASAQVAVPGLAREALSDRVR